MPIEDPKTINDAKYDVDERNQWCEACMQRLCPEDHMDMDAEPITRRDGTPQKCTECTAFAAGVHPSLKSAKRQRKNSKLEQDERIEDARDQALTDVVCRLAPLLTEGKTVSDLVEEFKQRIETHLEAELQIIADGPDGDNWHELSDQTKEQLFALGLFS